MRELFTAPEAEVIILVEDIVTTSEGTGVDVEMNMGEGNEEE